MALQLSRVTAISDALALLCDQGATYLADINRFLELNSDMAIDWAMATPTPKVFTATNATNLFTSNGHGLLAGQKGRVTNAGGALPAGLSLNTDYYVIAPAANTFQLSLTLGGAVVDITTDGTGTHTFSSIPEYITLDPNGNLNNRAYTPGEVSNAIGSLDQIRKLLTNQTPTVGDHLGNLNKLANATR